VSGWRKWPAILAAQTWRKKEPPGAAVKKEMEQKRDYKRAKYTDFQRRRGGKDRESWGVYGHRIRREGGSSSKMEGFKEPSFLLGEERQCLGGGSAITGLCP